MKISDEQAKIIEDCVLKVEKKTTGEFVPAMMESSDHYAVAHMRVALLVSFVAAVTLYFTIDKVEPIWFLWVQIPGLVIGYLLAYIPRIKRVFLRKSEIDEEVHQRALEVFFANELHSTKERNGVLIFISMLERKIELIADKGISDLVSKDVWNGVIESLILEIKHGDFTTGICHAIESCGDILKEHFPNDGNDINDINELKNSVITE